MGRDFLCKPDGEKFCSSKLDGFFPKLDLKISSQTLRVQELFSKAWWEDFFTNGMQRFASPKLDDGILLLLKAWQIGLISKLNENWLKDSCCRLLGYEREWGWLEETNRRGFKQLEKQPRSTHNCHSLCTHTQKHFNLQQTMIFFPREQVELVGYNFLQKGIRKKRVWNWKKNARGN